MDTTLCAEINQQIAKELYSSYLYLAMAAQAAKLEFPGAEKWLIVQAQEELDHAMGFYYFLSFMRLPINLDQLPAPDAKLPNVLSIARAALKHEQYVTGRIKLLADIAKKKGEMKFFTFNEWYLEEQEEEEENFEKIISELEKAGDDENALMEIDRKLGERTHHPEYPMKEFLKKI